MVWPSARPQVIAAKLELLPVNTTELMKQHHGSSTTNLPAPWLLTEDIGTASAYLGAKMSCAVYGTS